MMDPLFEMQQAVLLYAPKIEDALGVEIGPVEVVYSARRSHTRAWPEYQVNLMRICMSAVHANSYRSVESVHRVAMHELAHLATIKINPDLYFRKLTFTRRIVVEGCAEFISLDYLADSYAIAEPDMKAHLALVRQLDSSNGSWLSNAPEPLLALVGHIGPSTRAFWKQFISPYAFGYRFFHAIAEGLTDDWPGEDSTLEHLIDVLKHPDIPLAHILQPRLYMEAHGLSSG